MLYLILTYLRDLLRPQRDLLLENLALRQQLLVLERQVKRLLFKDRERAFWVILSRYWPGWKSSLRLVQPQTVISWHRQSWRLFWRWKSRPKDYGRPTQSWKTFLQNHLAEIAAIDFLTVPTVTFKTLYVFVVLSLDRRRVIHFHVTTHPTSEWTAIQLVQAFPFDSAPKYLIRDRDGIYGEKVQSTIDFLGMKEKVISARSPWQNGYCERMVGTIKRECLNHTIIFSEAHARRVLKKYFEYYHDDRTHLGLDKMHLQCAPLNLPTWAR